MTYEAVADAAGSINTTSAGKTNFWQYVGALFGANPAPDMGLAGKAMPGAKNVPQPMTFDAASASFVAEGVPITPYDDRGTKNFYPMMRLVRPAGDDGPRHDGRRSPGIGRNGLSRVPRVGDRGPPHSRPPAGSGTPTRPRDYKLNTLRLHDERQLGRASYTSALAKAGYAATGLYDTVVKSATPILCARCHLSNALPGTGIAGLPALTSAIHARHAGVIDPSNGLPLEAAANRTACYRCHPGSATKCLRGVMGAAVAADGTLAMQCQSCHGGMSAVGGPTGRAGCSSPPASSATREPRAGTTARSAT